MHEHDGYQSLITLIHNKHCSIWRSGFELGLLKSTKRLLDKRVIYTELPLQERSIINPPHSLTINTALIVSVTGKHGHFVTAHTGTLAPRQQRSEATSQNISHGASISEKSHKTTTNAQNAKPRNIWNHRHPEKAARGPWSSPVKSSEEQDNGLISPRCWCSGNLVVKRH